MPAYDDAYRAAQFERLKGKIEQQINSQFAGRGFASGAKEAIMADAMAKLRTEINLNADDKMASMEETRRQEGVQISERKRQEERADAITAQKESMARTDAARKESIDDMRYQDEKRAYESQQAKENEENQFYRGLWDEYMKKKGPRQFSDSDTPSVIPGVQGVPSLGGGVPVRAAATPGGFRTGTGSGQSLTQGNTGGQPQRYTSKNITDDRLANTPPAEFMQWLGTSDPRTAALWSRTSPENRRLYWLSYISGKSTKQVSEEMNASTIQAYNQRQNQPEGQVQSNHGEGFTDSGLPKDQYGQTKSNWWDGIFDSAGDGDFDKKNLGDLPPLPNPPQGDQGMGTTDDLRRDFLNQPRESRPGDYPGQNQDEQEFDSHRSSPGYRPFGTSAPTAPTAAPGYRQFDSTPGATFADKLQTYQPFPSSPTVRTPAIDPRRRTGYRQMGVS